MVEVPFGDSHIDVSLPDCSVTVATPEGREPVDVRSAARDAVSDPSGPPLAERVAPGEDVCIVVTDITRSTPEQVLLDVLVNELTDAGIDREAISVVVGLGLHRPLTDDEMTELLGEYADLAVNHDPDQTVRVGEVDGCPIELFEPAAEADNLISTGMVEPHQYAGFSGGAKTAVIGAAGESQIRYTHGPELLSRDGVRLGRIEDNPFRSFLDRAGDAAGVEFCLNVTHGPDGIMAARAGDPRAVVSELAEVALDALAVDVDEEYDAVVAGVGAPKDANLYQTTRAATYVILGANNPLRADGRVVVPAALGEGAGEGTGEQRFYERLSTATDAESLFEEMKDGYEPGAQRAFVVARSLREHDVWVTNSQNPAVVEECLLSSAPNVADAIEPGSDVLVVPESLDTLLR
ncbi:lactate racemase domain-containing protein [Halovenus salina]|uniref:Lactate racemase domain-containing protein n=1 Tax=Halovenus salina TaxID=1510225 RepID=A0ABD5W090_9EURY|nr:lactate racemase domain-containing protein [Halovenus salina]